MMVERWIGYPDPPKGKRTPYRVLADELMASRHAYRVWPPDRNGDPCCDCTGPADNPVHRDLGYVLYEAGLRTAEEIFNPAAGYHDPMKAQAVYRARAAEKQAERDANRVTRETAGAVPWKRGGRDGT